MIEALGKSHIDNPIWHTLGDDSFAQTDVLMSAPYVIISFHFYKRIIVKLQLNMSYFIDHSADLYSNWVLIKCS